MKKKRVPAKAPAGMASMAMDELCFPDGQLQDEDAEPLSERDAGKARGW